MQSSNAMIKLQYQDEIRRFQVNLDSSFSELFALVRQLYSISHSSIVLKWQDEESDLVTISTDDEVFVALNNSRLLRLFVYDAPVQTEDESEGPAEELSSEFDIESGVEEAPNDEEWGFKWRKIHQIEANLKRIESNLNDDSLPVPKKERLEQRREKLQTKLEMIKTGAAPRGRGGRGGRGRGGRGRGGNRGRGCPGRKNGQEQSPMENSPSSQPKMPKVKLVLLECRINLKNARASGDSSAVALAQASLKQAQANMCAHRQKMKQDRLAQRQTRLIQQTEKRALQAERKAARQNMQAEKRALRQAATQGARQAERQGARQNMQTEKRALRQAARQGARQAERKGTRQNMQAEKRALHQAERQCARQAARQNMRAEKRALRQVERAN